MTETEGRFIQALTNEVMKIVKEAAIDRKMDMSLNSIENIFNSAISDRKYGGIDKIFSQHMRRFEAEEDIEEIFQSFIEQSFKILKPRFGKS
jgi:hypothetical protein